MAGSKHKCICGFSMYFHTLLFRRQTIFHSCQHMSFVCVPTFLQWKLLLNFWYLVINYLMFYLSLPFFPSQTEDILVKLPLEDYSKGQVGCKTYKNYFTAGTDWLVIIFLILVNIAAQVRKGVYFGLCPQFGIYIYLYFIWASLVAQTVKRLPAMLETPVRFLGQEDPLEKEMSIHSSTLVWKIPWTEKPDRL